MVYSFAWLWGVSYCCFMFKLKKGLIFKKYEFAKLRKSWNGNVWFQIKCKEYEVLHKYKELLLSFAGICDTKLQSFPAFFFLNMRYVDIDRLIIYISLLKLCWDFVETLTRSILLLWYLKYFIRLIRRNLFVLKNRVLSMTHPYMPWKVLFTNVIWLVEF